MKEKLISIIVPVYNSEKYLTRCLDSICNQTYRNLEIILINDGSADGSGKICDSYVANDERVSVIHKKNEGVSVARNYGLDIAKGDYIGFVDSDDYIEEDMYETLLNLALEYDADIVNTGYHLVKSSNVIYRAENEKYSISTFTSFDEMIYNWLYAGDIKAYLWCKLYKAEIWNDLRLEEGYYYQDLMSILPLLQRCKKVVTIDKKCYYYVETPHSSTRNNVSVVRIDSTIHMIDLTSDFLMKYAPKYKEGIYWRYVRLLMQGFYLQDKIDLSYEDKLKYRFGLLSRFKHYYPIFQKSARFKSEKPFYKCAYKVFDISPYLFIIILRIIALFKPGSFF